MLAIIPIFYFYHHMPIHLKYWKTYTNSLWDFSIKSVEIEIQQYVKIPILKKIWTKVQVHNFMPQISLAILKPNSVSDTYLFPD